MTEIAKSLMGRLASIFNYILDVGKWLDQYLKSWDEETPEVVQKICKMYGVYHWTELVTKGVEYFLSRYITKKIQI
jgi:hypothetical protein